MTSTDPKLPAGTRPTRQRRAVAAVMQSFGDFRSAQDIHDLLRQTGENVGLSTVYRTLQALADGGEVDVLRTEDGEALYRRCSGRHHHHLVCRGCGRTVEVEGPTVEARTSGSDLSSSSSRRSIASAAWRLRPLGSPTPSCR